MSKPRALIVGGSLGGLFAAHLMRSIGWEAEVFERATGDLASRGVGLGTHDALFDVARRAGIAFDRSKGVAIDSYICLDRSGRIVHEMAMQRVMTAWTHIYRPLRDKLPSEHYHAGKQFERIEETENRVTACFADGSRLSAELLIGADGPRSTVREQFLPSLRPTYAGYIAWRALVAESDIPSAARAAVFDRYAFCLPDGEVAVSYPVPGPDGDNRPGKRSANIMWYRPVDAEALRDLCTDAQGIHHDAIPPPLLRSELTAAIRDDARAQLAAPIAEIFLRCPRPFFQPIYDLASPQLVFGRVALLGDAAFAARPHVGAGVTKAALDATSLADAIVRHDGNIGAALEGYDAVRRQFGDWLVARARGLGGAILARPAPSMNSGLETRAKAVLQDYAAIATDIRDWSRSRRIDT
jgi:2-polyprenyl-6-methoxyphenol hydroxylase-like FAD-dependent oxidoreductase